MIKLVNSKDLELLMVRNESSRIEHYNLGIRFRPEELFRHDAGSRKRLVTPVPSI